MPKFKGARVDEKPYTEPTDDPATDPQLGYSVLAECAICGTLATRAFTPIRFSTVYACDDHRDDVEAVLDAVLAGREIRVQKLNGKR